MSISLRKDNIIYPYFVAGGADRKEKILSFPGQYRLSVDLLVKDIKELKALGINKILLFGVPENKDRQGSHAYSDDNIVGLAVREIKKKFPYLAVFTDVCLCAYTSHGHCGIVKSRELGVGSREKKRFIDNKATLAVLAKIAVAHAEAGADYVAPSAMAKGQVAAIRKALDKKGFGKTKILGYSAKFASNFYGPFRNAAGSAPRFGDRKAYQLSYSNTEAALKEIEDDINEGADIVMVKPALGYLDIIKEAKYRFRHPIAAYNVSGEFAFVKYGAKQGLWDENEMVKEIITSIKRAGADYIITYHAKDVAGWLK
ncbi:MAG: porphobilinogen synthase [Candidatus Omnitrophota bacterium]|nr:porphobilinogen synthase [Candidatus Omnitrophota bacterium]